MKDREERALEIASYRYRIIADAAEIDGAGVNAVIEQAAARAYVDPRGRSAEVNARTLWRWLASFKRSGLRGLMPAQRKDAGRLRAMSPEVLDRAVALRRENAARATTTLIDILERQRVVVPGTLKRATLDRHLEKAGVARRTLHSLGTKTFRKILTTTPLELVIADFHHGPYVRVPGESTARRALLLAFIDHFSRYLLEFRYYLHEDFAALRFGFRRVLLLYGPFVRLYIDNGPSFHTGRFLAACNNDALDIHVVHSKAYTSEGRGCCERFNRTIKEQFESEVRALEDLPTLDELNGWLEAWGGERYHRDIHSETGHAPFEHFAANVTRRETPDLEQIDELLRLREQRKVHKKWSTVEVHSMRYVVDPALRGRWVHALWDPFDRAYVLIEYDGRITQRAYPQQAGAIPPELAPPPQLPGGPTNYLELLRRDHEEHCQREMAALDLRPATVRRELSLADLEADLATCRGQALSDAERREVGACFRKLRPLDPDSTRLALDGARRRLGCGLHPGVYLDVLETFAVRQRAKTRPPQPPPAVAKSTATNPTRAHPAPPTTDSPRAQTTPINPKGGNHR